MANKEEQNKDQNPLAAVANKSPDTNGEVTHPKKLSKNQEDSTTTNDEIPEQSVQNADTDVKVAPKEPIT